MIEARAYGAYSHRDVVGTAQYLDRNDAIMQKRQSLIEVPLRFGRIGCDLA